MANDDLKNRWQPCIRHAKHITAAQTLVMAETGVFVPADRSFAHMGIETGYTGDPKLKSRGVNSDSGTGCHKDGRCAPDLRAHGLFQIFWPPFTGVDWNNIHDAAYNCHIGLKVLAYRYRECGNWPGASAAFFSGSCTLNGTEDVSTGTDDATYRAALERNMQELNTLGIGITVGGSNGADPKDPPISPPDGGTNTPDDSKTCIPGTAICVDTGAIVAAQAELFTGRILVFVLGAALLLSGAWAVAR